MNSIRNAGPCANIGRVPPLLGTVVGFAALLVIMGGAAARLI